MWILTEVTLKYFKKRGEERKMEMKEQSERKRKKKGEKEGRRGKKKSICLFFILHEWYPKGKKMFWTTFNVNMNSCFRHCNMCTLEGLIMEIKSCWNVNFIVLKERFQSLEVKTKLTPCLFEH